MIRPIISTITVLAMLFSLNVNLLHSAHATEPSADTHGNPLLKNTTPVTTGTILKEYYWETAQGPAKIYVLEVDLSNPYVRVDAMTGQQLVTKRLNVSAMAHEAGAVAAINGDFFNTRGEGAPIGPMVINQQWMTSSSHLEGMYALGVTTDNIAYIEAFSFWGNVTAPNGLQYQLSGLNKSPYWEEPDGSHSHTNKLHLYNDRWGGSTRGNDSYTTPTEMLVDVQGMVLQIRSGEYIDTTIPEGMSILRGHGKAAAFLLNNFQPGDIVDIEYTVYPDKDWGMVVGGHTLLVEQGKIIPYTRSVSSIAGVVARTAAGISQNGETLYLVGVEGQSTNSKGLSLGNLASFFVEIGAWKALNLDGGGSTIMLARPLGEWTASRVLRPQQLPERLVANGIGIFSTAPPGPLRALTMEGPQVLLVNEVRAYNLKGYDEYYNPVDPHTLNTQWQSSKPIGNFIENAFVAKITGKTELSVHIGPLTASLPIKIVSKDDVHNMTLNTLRAPPLVVGSQVSLNLNLKTHSGQLKEVSPSLVAWQFYGFKGTVSEEGVLTVTDIEEGLATGFVVARYQGFSAPLPLSFAQVAVHTPLDTLEGLGLEVYPSDVKAELLLATDPENPDRQVTQLDYDFTMTTDTSAAYLRFEDGGIVLDAGAQGILLDIYGTEGYQWVRAELRDGKDTLHRFDFTSDVDWSGWKTVSLSFNAKHLSQPLRLERIYVVSLQEQKEEKATTGSLLFRNLQVKFPLEPAPLSRPELLELTVDKKQITIDGVPQEIDVAPLIIDGRTMVPIRFVSQALNAKVHWEDATKTVTIVHDQRWIDLWPQETVMVVDGLGMALDVAPKIIDGRTMLPLRAVAQALDMSVTWIQETRQIRIR